MRLASPRDVVFELDPRVGIVSTTYPQPVVLSPAMADELLPHLDALVAERGSLLLLVDGRNVVDAHPAYRQRVGAWFKANRSRVRMACHGMSPFVTVMATLFARGTGLPLRAFRSEADARAWLVAEARRQSPTGGSSRSRDGS